MGSLLVPIALDVLMVRTGTTAEPHADIAVREVQARSGQRVRSKLDTEPFALTAAPRAPGAYLHWALPDAMTRGDSTPDSITLPIIPDRWLVLRLVTPADGSARQLTGWLIPDAGAAQPIIQSDVLGGSSAAPTLPASQNTMTVLGPGSFSWAACYDNIEGRFGLHDDLAGVTGAVSYLVCGWYTNGALDPIAAASDTAFLDRLDDLDWSLSRRLEPREARPQSCLFHAAALGFGWPDAQWPGGGPIGLEREYRPDSANIEVALGETLAEAVVAVLANNVDPATGSLLEARLTGILGDPSGIDGVSNLMAGLNAARFSSEPGESTVETIWQPKTDSDPDSDAKNNPLAGGFAQVARAAPRNWKAVNPAIVLEGAGRSGRYGGDGRFGEENDLVCRIEGDTVSAFGLAGGDRGGGIKALPPLPLAGLPAAYGVPPAVEPLLVELASLDPACAPDIDTTSATPAPIAALRAGWWASFADGAIEADVLAQATITGALPSPIAICPPSHPWNPIHLDWEVSYLPSPHGVRDWVLGDHDFSLPDSPAFPPSIAEQRHTGRVTLDSSAARMIESLIEDGSDSVAAAPIFDLIGGSLEDFIASLRGDERLAVISQDHGNLDDPFALGPRPADFQPLRAGFLRIERLRVIDGFGRFADLGVSVPQVKVGRTLYTPDADGLAALRPRFTAPAQVRMRFIDAAGSGTDAGPAASPICGYVLPATNDISCELFDADGTGLGRLRNDPAQGASWEEAPGTDASLGARPAQHIGNRYLAGLAEGVYGLDAATAAPSSGGGTALESLLRILDAAHWSSDVTGPAGDEHLSLMLGQPIAVVRASIRIDVFDERTPPENALTAVPVRLGSLAQLTDGLLGYFIADDYTRLHVIDPSVVDIARRLEAQPLLDTYVDDTGLFYCNPGIEVPLTLLMIPGASVQITTGVLPQKQLTLLRQWTSAALAQLSPTLRFGPVLRDDPGMRVPVAPDIRGDWLWHRRPDPTSWLTDKVTPANTAAQLPDGPVLASSGWLQVKLLPDGDYPEGQIGTRIMFVTKDARGFIREVGGYNEDGSSFLMPTGQAAMLHESGRFRFYVQRDGATTQTEIRVVTRRSGRKYLRSKADRTDDNNLLNLPPPPF